MGIIGGGGGGNIDPDADVVGAIALLSISGIERRDGMAIGGGGGGGNIDPAGVVVDAIAPL